MKYQDKRKVGRSKLVPWKSGEPYSARHTRRLKAALEAQNRVKGWCENNGVILTISNEGHHWKFVLRGRVAEWWPSSAKLVLGENYKNGIHCHDYHQLLFVFRSEWLTNSFDE